MDFQQILEIPVFVHGPNQSMPLKDCIYRLNCSLFADPDSFNSKRPYGNSGWVYEIYKSLVKAKLIEGRIDDDCYLVEVNELEAHMFLVEKVLRPLFHQPSR